MRTTRNLAPTFVGALTVLVVAALSATLGPHATYAKGPNDPATECLIAVSAGGSFVDLQCKDGDACDADGQTGNGSCTVNVTACTNVVASGCTAQELKSAKVKPKKLGLTISPSGTSSVCGNGQVLLKLRGRNKDKPSKKRNIVALAKGTSKGAKDVDKIKVQCVPCDTASCVPTTTTSAPTPSTSTTTSTIGSTSTAPATTSTVGSTSTTSTTTSTVAATSTTPPTTATTTSTVAATSTTPPTTSTTTSTPVSTSTSTSIPSGFDFLSTPASGSCGNTFRDLAGTIPLKNLNCGSLSLGGGLSQVPDNATPPGATNRFTLSGCVGTTCDIGPTTSGSTPAGVDCTDVGCRFGTPLPISNAGLSVCVTNTFGHAPTPVAPSGTLDLSTGAATWDFELNSATVLTGNPSQPCPICAVSVGGAACAGSPDSPCTGVCDGSPNQGEACESKNPNGLTSDCPSPAATAGTQRCYRGANNDNVCSTGADCPGGLCAQFIGDIAIDLSPLTTGTSSLSNASGLFCPGQTASQHGAFKSDICQTGANSGLPCDRNAMGQDPTHCGAGVTCRAGTLTNYCTAGTNDGLGCAIAADCGTGGVCSRAGTFAQLISETGTPAGALSVGVPSTIKLGSAFCVAATSNPTVNSNANLPAAGATNIVGTVTLLP